LEAQVGQPTSKGVAGFQDRGCEETISVPSWDWIGPGWDWWNYGKKSHRRLNASASLKLGLGIGLDDRDFATQLGLSPQASSFDAASLKLGLATEIRRTHDLHQHPTPGKA
jgi:hypothetical protein